MFRRLPNHSVFRLLAEVQDRFGPGERLLVISSLHDDHCLGIESADQEARTRPIVASPSEANRCLRSRKGSSVGLAMRGVVGGMGQVSADPPGESGRRCELLEFADPGNRAVFLIGL